VVVACGSLFNSVLLAAIMLSSNSDVVMT
jgi:hypothetical protein